MNLGQRIVWRGGLLAGPAGRAGAWLGSLTVTALGVVIGLWVRLCGATTRWERHGDAELAAALAEGPVVLILWHERLPMAGVHWRREWGPMAALRTMTFRGRVAGAALAHLRLDPIAMSSWTANLGASREVMRRLRATGGGGVGLTADGPAGPARVPKGAPLEWARAAGRPVFLYAYGTRSHLRLRTWDRMMWPLPFTRGVCVYRRWDHEMPRRGDDASREAARLALTAALDAIGMEADALARASEFGRMVG